MNPSDASGQDACAAFRQAITQLKTTFEQRVEQRAILFNEELEKRRAGRREENAAVIDGDSSASPVEPRPKSDATGRIHRASGGGIVWDRGNLPTTIGAERAAQSFGRAIEGQGAPNPDRPQSPPPPPQPLLTRVVSAVVNRLNLSKLFSR